MVQSVVHFAKLARGFARFQPGLARALVNEGILTLVGGELSLRSEPGSIAPATPWFVASTNNL